MSIFFGFLITLSIIALYPLTHKQEAAEIIYSYLLVPVLLIGMALWLRRRVNNGKIRLREGLKVSLSIAFAASVFTTLYFLLFYLYISPGSLEVIQDRYGFTTLPIEQVMVFDLGMQFIAISFVGSMAGAIITFLLHKRTIA